MLDETEDRKGKDSWLSFAFTDFLVPVTVVSPFSQNKSTPLPSSSEMTDMDISWKWYIGIGSE